MHLKLAKTALHSFGVSLFSLLIASVLIAVCASPKVSLSQEVNLELLRGEVQRLNDARLFSEALPKARQALGLAERKFGLEHPDIFQHLLNIGETYLGLQRPAEAEIAILRAQSIAMNMGSNGRTKVARCALLLVDLYISQKRNLEAKHNYELAAEIVRQQFKNYKKFQDVLYLHLASAHKGIGLYEDAEKYLLRALQSSEENAPNPLKTAEIEVSLAEVYSVLRRDRDSERFLRKAEVSVKSANSDDKEAGVVYRRVGEVHGKLGQWVEAEQAARLAVAKLRDGSREARLEGARSEMLLAASYAGRSNWKLATAAAMKALSAFESELAPDHPEVAEALTDFGYYASKSGNDVEAAAALEKAQRTLRRLWGDDGNSDAKVSAYLGAVFVARGDWERAASTLKYAITIASQEFKRTASIQLSRGGSVEYSISQPKWYTEAITNLLLTAYERHLNRGEPALSEDSDAALIAFQRLNDSAAAAALRQMSLRLAKNDTRLGAFVRERQDLAQSWRVTGNALAELLAKPAVGRDRKLEREHRDKISIIETQIDALDKQLSQQFGEFFDLTQPDPVSTAELRSQLGENEVAIVIGDIVGEGEQTGRLYIWAIDKNRHSRWLRSALRSSQVRTEVQALRCGLDARSWSGTASPRCQALVPGPFTAQQAADGKPLPFDPARAYNLYTEIFGQIEEVLRNSDGTWKDMVVIPSGALTQLPFQVLVTEKPKHGPYTDARDLASINWLGTRQSITVLPSVSSIKTLRRDGRRSAATRPYFAVANPQLEGQLSSENDQAMKVLANAWQSCERTDLAGACRAAFPRLTSGRPLDPVKIREWSPLPQTACEICAIGSRLNGFVRGRDVRLGKLARERDIKQLGEIVAGRQRSVLQDYRVIHFATHAAVADIANGYPEPGLILTPPDSQASEDDDGYLTASEIMRLKLDADWVILSACSTAAGTAESSEALSGLARAFFYAGARALLVSNWEVYTNAAVDLTTRTLQVMAADAKLSRAAAVRLSLDDMIRDAAKSKDIFRLHPSYWGAFSIVGEGSR